MVFSPHIASPKYSFTTPLRHFQSLFLGKISYENRNISLAKELFNGMAKGKFYVPFYGKPNRFQLARG